MIEPVIGFLGAGNMAEALIRGLINKNICHPEKIICSDIDKNKLQMLNQYYSIQTAATNLELINRAQVIVLAVKPQQAESVLLEIKEHIQVASHSLISIAAGLTTTYIESCLNKPVKIIRVMPNTPARIQAGAAAYCLGRHATENEGMVVQLLFDAIGIIIQVDEAVMNAVTAVSGSGPAYVFKLCEMMISSALEMGIEQPAAEQLTIHTIFGAAQLLKESGGKASELREAVTSPGGTTEAALKVMHDFGIDTIFRKAILAARDRGQALSPSVKKEV